MHLTDPAWELLGRVYLDWASARGQFEPKGWGAQTAPMRSFTPRRSLAQLLRTHHAIQVAELSQARLMVCCSYLLRLSSD